MLSFKPSDMHSKDRGGSNQAVAQGRPSTPEINTANAAKADLQKQCDIIEGYMQAGGQLPMPQGRGIPTQQQVQAPSEGPTRRALIIAPQYAVHITEKQILSLNSTLYDVVRIYQMLISYGYKASDIRILAEGLGMEVLPSRKNILDNLDWLVRDAREQDYRFLHFSGHGTYFDATPQDGKLAASIEAPNKPVRPDDPERDPKGRSIEYTKIDELRIYDSKFEMKYYKEAEDTYADTRGPVGSTTTPVTDRNFMNVVGSTFQLIATFTSAPRMVLKDSLPEEEQNKDNIKADVIFWSACHQRQPAKNGFNYGLFTDVFTRKVEEQRFSALTIADDVLWKNF
ncbi:hypothetical protein BN14_05612 [Rhizoctonia solani AG-1 IB]|uniref:Peptidase C14 caspase domain-containing protein n=1 Tax=Thanatephorus cucumeris (strain AG1-IB / isolate 7/3/14) TaxID=1108050 RepID=M5C6R6_THACB|nr:hypothetical protein BN14_05612 [Rhizoctonia solani AG-1 IB]